MSKLLEKQIRFKKDSVLFREGESGDFFYFIVHGSVGIYCSHGSSAVPLAVLRDLQAVGDLGAFNKNVRSATAIALTDVSVIKISREDIDEQIALCPLWFSTIITTLVERLRGANEIIRRNGIQDSHLLDTIRSVADQEASKGASEATSDELKDLLDEAVPTQEQEIRPERTVLFKKGDIVFNEGDAGGYFYFIVKGSVGVFKDYEKERIPLAKLHELQVLGEMSVVDGKSRSATAVALTDVEAMRITGEGFDQQLYRHRIWFRAVIRTIVERVRSTNGIIDRSKVRDAQLVSLMQDAYINPDFSFHGSHFQAFDEQSTLVAGEHASESDTSGSVVRGSEVAGKGESSRLIDGERLDLMDQSEIRVKGGPCPDGDDQNIVVKSGSPASARQPALIRVAGKQKAVLVVDPDTAFLEEISRKMEPSGIEVIGCKTADEAQLKLANQKFGCLLINLHLQRGNTVNLINHIRYLERNSETRMPIFVLASPGDSAAVKGLKETINAAFVAPLSLEAIVERVERLF